MGLLVLSAGGLTTVQDMGRMGYERFGVPQSGAMDWYALHVANRLVGNPPAAAGIEFALEAPLLQADAECLVAAAGWGWDLWVQGRRVGAWRAAYVRSGEVIHFTPADSTGWGYLCVAGGIDTPVVMGSRSTYLRGGFGGFAGQALQPGDLLPVGSSVDGGDPIARAGCWLPPALRPVYGGEVTIPVILGPQVEAFTREGLETFLSQAYTVSPNSDRMGYRLSGPKISHRAGADVISEGIAAGSVQVPADGQPIVMMSDRPTTGGYAKIATLARVGLPLAVQAMPGVGVIRFAPVSVAEAQQRFREAIKRLEKGVQDGCD